MSWPVAGTIMIEPTESENLGEIDKFANALIKIKKEINFVEENKFDKLDNPLKMLHIHILNYLQMIGNINIQEKKQLFQASI